VYYLILFKFSQLHDIEVEEWRSLEHNLPRDASLWEPVRAVWPAVPALLTS
jgi:hypothetical protein